MLWSGPCPAPVTTAGFVQRLAQLSFYCRVNATRNYINIHKFRRVRRVRVTIPLGCGSAVLGKAGPLLLEEQGAGLITIKAQPDGTSIQHTRASRRVRETALGSVSRARPRGLALVRGRASMTPRERVLTALQHERPDRTPCDFWAEPPTWKVLPCSTPEQVRAIAQRYCSSLGAGGGYILGPAHCSSPTSRPRTFWPSTRPSESAIAASSRRRFAPPCRAPRFLDLRDPAEFGKAVQDLTFATEEDRVSRVYSRRIQAPSFAVAGPVGSTPN